MAPATWLESQRLTRRIAAEAMADAAKRTVAGRSRSREAEIPSHVACSRIHGTCQSRSGSASTVSSGTTAARLATSAKPLAIMTASSRPSCQRRLGARCDQSRPSIEKSEGLVGAVISTSWAADSSARTPFLSVASAEADAMLVAVIFVVVFLGPAPVSQELSMSACGGKIHRPDGMPARADGPAERGGVSEPESRRLRSCAQGFYSGSVSR